MPLSVLTSVPMLRSITGNASFNMVNRISNCNTGITCNIEKLYATSTLTDQSSSTAVGSTKLSPLCNGIITGDAGTPVSPTEQIKSLPV